MKILLDTHILIAAAIGDLSKSRAVLLDDCGNELYIASISLWEIVKLHELKRVEVEAGLEKFLFLLCRHPRYTLVELTPEILLRVPEVSRKMHRDPADQILVATALHLDATLMTNDKKIEASHLVQTL